MIPSHNPAIKVQARKTLRVVGLTCHVAAICVLAYDTSARLVDLTGVCLYQLGLAWSDAVVVTSMLGFLFLLAILLWAFSRRSILRTWLHVGALAAVTLLVQSIVL
jgi:hypothetical protein